MNLATTTKTITATEKRALVRERDELQARINRENQCTYIENGYRNGLSPREYQEATARIKQIESVLKNSTVIKTVILGKVITVIKNDGEELQLTILVNPKEDAKDYLVCSLQSELGRALMGSKIGDEVTVTSDGKSSTYTVKDIAD